MKSQDKLKTEAAEPIGPQGQRLVLNLSAGLLNPGAGLRSRRTGIPEKCGTMWGTVERCVEHPNFKDATKTSRRWHGSFGYQRADGKIGDASTVYLQGVLERQLESLGCPVVREGMAIPPFTADFSIEIWAEPDLENTPKPSAQGYVYAVYNRMPPARAVSHLAPPEVRALLSVPEEATLVAYYNPETGDQADADGVVIEPEPHHEPVSERSAAE
jgi:hypothetical protein